MMIALKKSGNCPRAIGIMKMIVMARLTIVRTRKSMMYPETEKGITV